MSPRAPTANSRGTVLVNALVLVAALSAVAVSLMARAERSVLRQSSTNTMAQVRLLHEAAETALRVRLDRDAAGDTASDHGGEDWAQPIMRASVDRGQLSAGLDDLQGRFNVNWLSGPDGPAFEAALQRLADSRGVSSRAVTLITAAASEGPVLDPEQLRALPGLRSADADRLLPLLAALPGDATLNVNTAPAALLQALLPGLDPMQADALVSEARRRPFPSVAAFMAALPIPVAQAANAAWFGIGSDWFLLTSSVWLDGRETTRRGVLRRRPLPVGARLVYRLSDG